MENRHNADEDQENAPKITVDRHRRRILKWLEVAQFLVPVFALSGLLLIFLPKVLEVTTNRAPKKSANEKLFEYLSNGLENNLLDAEFLGTAFSHFDRQSNGALVKYGYIETLEDFIVYLNSPDQNSTSSRSNSTASIIQLLTEARETEPFASLPSEERRLMDYIQTLVSNQASNEDLAHAMNELKQVLLARHKEYLRIESQNAWSIPLAIAGLILTVVFGVWSLVLSIRRKRLELQDFYYGKEPVYFRDNDEVRVRPDHYAC
jgi:hypothetical protein